MATASYDKERLDVSRATDADIAALVAFHNAQYATSRTPAQWRWQYQGHLPEDAVFVVARSRGRIIGTQAAMPVRLRLGGRVVLTGKSENTLLDPAFRGQGVMEDLYEHMVSLCQEQGMACLWGFTDAVKAFRRFGFVTHPVVETWSRPGWDLPAALRRRLTAPRPWGQRLLAGGKAAWDFSRGAPHLLRPHRPLLDGTVQSAPVDADPLVDGEQAWERQPDRAVYLHTDDDYLAWRVASHPFLRYELTHLRRSGRLDGYALSTQHGGERALSAWQGRDPDALSSLLGAAVQRHQGRAARLVLVENGVAPDSPARRRVLRRHGFDRTFVTHLVLRDLSDALTGPLAEPGAWRVNGLWTEGYSL